MIAAHDLTTVTILRNAFRYAANNPHEVEHMLCDFSGENKAILGEKYFDNAVKTILENKIKVFTSFRHDEQGDVQIVVSSSGRESDQFIGEYGQQTIYRKNDPIVYARFNANKFSGKEIRLLTSTVKKNSFWANFVAECGDFASPITDIGWGDKYTTITLRDDIPEGTSMKGWVVRTWGNKSGFVESVNMDDVNINIELYSVGDPALIRIYGILVRWSIKKFRLEFDNRGIQLATFGYSATQLIDGSAPLYKQDFSISAKVAESWIDREFDTMDKAGKIDICLIASRLDGNEESEVFLD